MRELAGVIAKDYMRYRVALGASDSSYLQLCNRRESLEAGPDGESFRCNWRWTSDLHAPKVMPRLGLELMRRSLADHPVRMLDGPGRVSNAPRVSFIVGHRGAGRLPHLLATLRSIAGQEGTEFECIVVEQDAESALPGHLPSWVRHVHTPPPANAMPYCRSWAFNVGASLARGDMLVLHDNDMLVPADYAARLLGCARQGYEIVNLKRFIFYLSETHTRSLFHGSASLLSDAPGAIMQNAEAGGSIAVSREGFERIGGMDESFVGWGGEDNEFWERAQSISVWPWGSLPMVHLWHAAQPGKQDAENPTARRYRASSEIAPAERIRALRESPRGRMSGPYGWDAS